MKYNKTTLKKALSVNAPVAEQVEAELQTAIDTANVFIRQGGVPTGEALDAISKKVSELAPFSQWVTVLESLVNVCETEGVEELTDEQVRITLTKIRKYTKWKTKVNKTTKYIEKTSTQEKIDLIGMFDKLDVDISEFKKYFPSLTLAIALTANARMQDGTEPEKLIANYKGDEEVRKMLVDGADFTSRNSKCKIIEACVNAYMPSSEFKAFKRDAEFFYLAGTQLSRKEDLTIKSGITDKLLEAFFDYTRELLLKNGVVRYNVQYKSKKITAKEYEMLKDYAVENSTATDKPVEAPAAEPTAEPVAAKEEPKTKSKSGTKRGSKKSDKTAA